MTRSTARFAGIGAGALLALGLFTAAPAGAADGAQADADVQVDTADAINQTLDLVNQACTEASRAGSTAASALASEHGITVAAQPAGGALNLQVSLPALTESLPSLGSLPLLGSIAGEVDATQPLQITCAASADGTGLGLTAAGVDVLVDAIAPGVDVSGLNLDIPVDASASATTSAVPGSTSVSATAAGSLPATQAKAAPSARVSAAAPAATTTTSAAAEAAPATTSDSSVSAGTLARTGAGLGGLGLLGGVLIGGGRLLAFGRRFLGIG